MPAFYSSRAPFRAQNLIERARDRIDLNSSAKLVEQAADQRRVRWWIDAYFGKSKSRFSKHLREMGVDPANFIYLLQPRQETGGTLRSVTKKRARGQSAFPQDNHNQRGGIGRLCACYFEGADYQFSLCINRVIKKAFAVDRQSVLSDFRQYLYNRVADLIAPSLILEANIKRLSFSEASSPEKRFKMFISSLSVEENQKKFWDKYPVLQRRVLTVIDNATQMCIETITHVAQDREQIENAFGIDSCSILKSVGWGSGDSHCQGRVVAILHFKGAKLVYKPRSVKVDKAYNQFLDWYKQTCSFSTPRTYRILDLGSYGYAEFIKSKKASSKSDIANYYHKQGQLIALAWLLGITDLHHENLIASGGDPYLIDLETMFDRLYRRPSNAQILGFLYSKSTDAFLFRTGLLPNRRRGDYGVYDTSAIGASGVQPAPFGMTTIKNLGRDDAKLVSSKGMMPRQPNKPVLDGYNYSAYQYTKEIIQGYVDAIDVLQENKTLLLGKGSPLKVFKGTQLRWVARDTASYAQILQRMTHPTVLRDAIECDMLLGGNLWSQVDSAPHLTELIPSEIADLWDDDIPYFWTTFDTRSLYDSRKKERANFFEESCAQGIIRRLGMIETMKTRQVQAIELAMRSTVPIDYAEEALFTRHRLSAKRAKISADEVIATSVNIGKDLLDKKYDVENKPFWAGLMAIDDTSFAANVLPPTMYDGAPGIGIFLAQLYTCTRMDAFKSAALEAHDFVRFLMRLPMRGTVCGAYNGYGGLLYADMLMSCVLDRPLDEKSGALGRLKRFVEHDDNFDIMSGSAGALLIALRWFSRTKDRGAIEVAASAAQKLKEAAEYQKIGVTWNTLKDSNYSRRLGGLSHGVTGIAWALSEWAEFSNDGEARILASQAFSYEQTLFDKDHGTWVDARHNNHMCHWCHGAVGIGLAVNKMRSTLGNIECDKTIHLAQQATWKYGFMNSHCLCHGNLGNSEIFLVQGDMERSTEILSGVLIDHKRQEAWRCGLPASTTTPGLMCGLAGIGYSLLRHVYPDKLPNILALDI